MRKIKKPFINMMTYPVKRHKYNPMRFILGDWYLTHSLQKFVNQQDLDVKYVRLDKLCKNPEHKLLYCGKEMSIMDYEKQNRSVLEQTFYCELCNK